MNYLAHAWLAGDFGPFLAGGMAADYIKGPAHREIDPALWKGVMLHRQVDSFTDAHPVCRRARGRFSSPRRRYSGILLDLAFDHFLAVGWSRHAGRPALGEFSRAVYDALEGQKDLLPASFLPVMARMKAGDWLTAYHAFEAVPLAIDRVAGRVRGGEAMRGAGEEIAGVYRELEGDFDEFFPELCQYARLARLRLEHEA